MLYKEYSDMGLDKLQVVQDTMGSVPTGRFLEIGTREGGTAAMALSAINSTSVFCVDPYGDVDFLGMDGRTSEYRFSDMMYLRTLEFLAIEARKYKKNFALFKTTSSSFFNMQVEYWEDQKQYKLEELKYTFVLLDGDHTTKNVANEVRNLESRMEVGGKILIDNIDWIDENIVKIDEKPRFDMAIIKF